MSGVLGPGFSTLPFRSSMKVLTDASVVALSSEAMGPLSPHTQIKPCLTCKAMLAINQADISKHGRQMEEGFPWHPKIGKSEASQSGLLQDNIQEPINQGPQNYAKASQKAFCTGIEYGGWIVTSCETNLGGPRCCAGPAV